MSGRRNARRGQATGRRGITLLELLLVLALLVAVAALAAPSVGVTLDSGRLRSAADLVRARLAKARVKAMETGRTYVFRYQPSGSTFMIEPWYSQDDYLEASAESAAELGAGGVIAAAPAADLDAQDVEQLPEGVRFAAVEMVTDVRAEMLMQTSQLDQAMDGDWSPPVFFYPDGTSSTARLVIANARQRFVTLTMRGLTGVVRVSQPATSTELLP